MNDAIQSIGQSDTAVISDQVVEQELVPLSAEEAELVGDVFVGILEETQSDIGMDGSVTWDVPGGETLAEEREREEAEEFEPNGG